MRPVLKVRNKGGRVGKGRELLVFCFSPRQRFRIVAPCQTIILQRHDQLGIKDC